ncbi:putative colanic acid biosynthesis acetyltransferase [Brucella pseudogrignonensis]|uniref:Colanic acid biosynthesis acetyltransferase WcaF n=1 Tax=Brucella pseudogrignonensis TaxID=419475 RepID=A0ABU1MAE8_9HYPH|nr:putative colanic acid biosynthesis acetyltransferase [Brucella pseudogrignonensis]MDR6433012.1 putative colanic acid biosynthesis acetyltransferase WcaF [Brucella pseudogrignonensis]
MATVSRSDPRIAISGRKESSRPMEGGATFTLSHRIQRLCWQMTWLLLAAWTPSFLWRWRGTVLRAFGASIHKTAIVRASARIWWPANLVMDAHSSLGPGALCYNVAPVTLAPYAIVSQRAHLCTAGHNIDHHDFPLIAAPILIGPHAWIAAEAFVGPGVTIGEGAVLGARGVSFRDMEPWMVYAGNPAKQIRARRRTVS